MEKLFVGLKTALKKLPDVEEHKQFKKQYKRYVKYTDAYNTDFKQEDAHRSKYRRESNTVHCYDCNQDIKGGKAQYEAHAASNKHKTRVEEIKTAMNASQHYKKKLRARREKNQDGVETRRPSLAEQGAVDAKDSEEVLVWEDAPKGVATTKTEEQVGDGRRRRGRTKHRAKRRTVKPAHIKHLISRITRLMH